MLVVKMCRNTVIYYNSVFGILTRVWVRYSHSKLLVSNLY